jgi:hypothetical protein
VASSFSASVLAILSIGSSLSAEAEPPDIRVRYLSAETVYVSAGTAPGLAVGDKLEIVRSSEVIAEVEVIFVAEHSASCRVVTQQVELRKGDSARLIARAEGPGSYEPEREVSEPAGGSEKKDNYFRVRNTVPSCLDLRVQPSFDSARLDCLELGTRVSVVDSEGYWRKLLLDDGREGWVVGRFLEPDPLAAAGPVVAETSPLAEPGADLEAEAEVSVHRSEEPDWSAADRGARSSSPAEAPAQRTATERIVERSSERRSRSPARTRVSGALTVDWEDFTDDSEAGLDFQQSTARLSLRVGEIAGTPYSLRVRLRTQKNDRTMLSGIEESEDRDRFYELSLTYDPPEGRFGYRVGRIATSPIVATGYMDGLLGRVTVSRLLQVGGFFGARSDVEEIGFESTGQQFGLFARLASPNRRSRRQYEVIVAGAREEGEEDVSREFVSLQSRFSSGSRWFFYQRLELDLNRGWREELTGESSQLSNVSLTATRRIKDNARITLSYDRFEQYRSEETRSIPEELFNNQLRQGLRAALHFGKPRGINFTVNAGFRDQEGDSENTLSYGFGVRHPDIASRGVSLGVNVVGFSNPFTEGYVATLNGTKRLPKGSQISLTLGDRLSRDATAGDLEDLSTQWARVGAWVELPRNLFVNAEYETTSGDEFEGERLSAGLGYRF